MKFTLTHEPGRNSQLTFQIPGAEHPQTLYFLPGEFKPGKYPHILSDCGRVISFWGNRMVIHDSHTNLACSGQDGSFQTPTDIIHTDTFHLLKVLNDLQERKVPRAVVDTETLHRRQQPGWPRLTVGQIARHTNLRGQEYYGKTLRLFHDRLQGGERTFNDLMNDLSRIVSTALLYACGGEFYFDGRNVPNGCGFNGGVILHQNRYGIHT
jgi:hypothetical protein